MKKIVVLISGRGSNFVAIQETALREQWEETIGAKIVAVISNRPEAKGLELARGYGIEAVSLDHKLFETREAFEEKLLELVQSYEPDLVVLAGFMRILTEGFVKHFPGKILNIHPAVLPSFKGLDTHQRAIDAGVRVHGTTVHFVTAALDGGAIIGQAVVPVLPSDDEHTLADRVLGYEHQLFSRAVKACVEGKIQYVNERAVMDDETALSLTLLAH
ncbi:MAG: phosphoribosylglycinamide formyltransferase [Burkholderiaceae bacterium]|jgi:phosphoribosylglycinamide formyltransferase-1|nr:phosphoribosylglycinamide formyltransferase [Burkholderiaceae bacterium]MBR2959955.1 phosphoribosylglycinamide formyltransferase [Burkholderiaceae bacterium]